MKLETHPQRQVIGMECRASNEDPQAIGALWGRFMAEQLADQIPNRRDHSLIAVYCDYEGDHTQPYTFFLGCVVDGEPETPEGFSARVIPAGSYARRRASGPMPAALMNEWADIWSSGLPRSFIADFEIHDPAQPESVNIYVGIQ